MTRQANKNPNINLRETLPEKEDQALPLPNIKSRKKSVQIQEPNDEKPKKFRGSFSIFAGSLLGANAINMEPYSPLGVSKKLKKRIGLLALLTISAFGAAFSYGLESSAAEPMIQQLNSSTDLYIAQVNILIMAYYAVAIFFPFILSLYLDKWPLHWLLLTATVLTLIGQVINTVSVYFGNFGGLVFGVSMFGTGTESTNLVLYKFMYYAFKGKEYSTAIGIWSTVNNLASLANNYGLSTLAFQQGIVLAYIICIGVCLMSVVLGAFPIFIYLYRRHSKIKKHIKHHSKVAWTGFSVVDEENQYDMPDDTTEGSSFQSIETLNNENTKNEPTEIDDAISEAKTDTQETIKAEEEKPIDSHNVFFLIKKAWKLMFNLPRIVWALLLFDILLVIPFQSFEGIANTFLGDKFFSGDGLQGRYINAIELVANIICTAPFGLIMDKYGYLPYYQMFHAVIGIAKFTLLFYTNVNPIIPITLSAGLMMGSHVSSILLTRIVPENDYSLALGVYSTLYSIGCAVGPIIILAVSYDLDVTQIPSDTTYDSVTFTSRPYFWQINTYILLYCLALLLSFFIVLEDRVRWKGTLALSEKRVHEKHLESKAVLGDAQAKVQ